MTEERNIIPQFYTETIWPKIEMLEPVSLNGNKFRRIRTKLMFADIKNNNGRVYKRGLIEREIGKIQEKINRHKVVGETDHPDDMVSRIRNIGVKWEKIWVEQDGGMAWVKGEGLIPHTSMGKELDACIEAGISVGFSARGRGTLMPGNWKNEKVMLMQDDWQLHTFDAVVGESNEGADIEDTWTEATKPIKRKPQGLTIDGYVAERESNAGVAPVCDGLLVCGECLTEVGKMEKQLEIAAMTPAIIEGREEDKAAQQARAKKFNIAIKQGGNITKPNEYKNIPDDEFADPVNFRYPIDEDHIRAASAYWAKPKNQKQYSNAEKGIISKRIDSAKKKYKVGEYKENANEQMNLPKVSGLTFKTKITDDEVWKNFVKNNYITGMMVVGNATAYYAEYSDEMGWMRELYKFSIESVRIITEPNENPGIVTISDEGNKIIESEVSLAGSLAYENYDGNMTSESLANAMSEYLELGGIVYYNDKPIGRIDSWQGKAQIAEKTNEEGKGGDSKMDIKDLKVEDIQKDRPDLIESVRKSVESEIQTKLKDKAFLESMLKAAGIGLPEPPKAEVKVPDDVKALETKLADLEKKVAEQGQVIQEQADKIKAEADRKAADAKIDEELKSPAYEKAHTGVKEIVKKRLSGKISKPEYVSEQVRNMVETITEFSSNPGKGIVNLPGSEGTPPPATEQTSQTQDAPDAMGLTSAKKASLAAMVPVKA